MVSFFNLFFSSLCFVFKKYSITAIINKLIINMLMVNLYAVLSSIRYAQVIIVDVNDQYMLVSIFL